MLRSALSGLAGLALAGAAAALPSTFVASNPGVIGPAPRLLTWTLAELPARPQRAELRLQLRFDTLPNLRLRLLRNGNRLAELSAPAAAGRRLDGSYRFSDRGTGTLALQAAEPGLPVLPSHFAYRLSSRNGASECVLGLDALFAVDFPEPDGELQLEVQALGAGSGSIDSALLLLDDAPEGSFAAGFEGPSGTPPCRRPPLDIAFNTLAASAPMSQSPLALVSGQQPFASGEFSWRFRAFDPALGNYGPAVLGTVGIDQVAVGRWGGQAKSYLAVWRESEARLYVGTGAGLASIDLPGEFAGTQSRPIPGDYDGDGIDDLAVVFKVGGNPWVARIRNSSNGQVYDVRNDPRPNGPFDQGRLAFGPGADIDGNGRDELIVLQEDPQFPGTLQFLRQNADSPGFGLSRWGLPSDRVVYGRFRASPAAPISVLVVVRRNAGANLLEWYLFPNGTPVPWGLADDVPLSADFSGDGIEDIAVWRPSDRRHYYLDSSTGLQVATAPFEAATAADLPLGFVQGVLGLPEN